MGSVAGRYVWMALLLVTMAWCPAWAQQREPPHDWLQRLDGARFLNSDGINAARITINERRVTHLSRNIRRNEKWGGLTSADIRGRVFVLRFCDDLPNCEVKGTISEDGQTIETISANGRHRNVYRRE